MRQYTDSQMANTNFFGNWCGVTMQIEELESYLNEVHKYIEVTNYHLQNDKIKGYDIETLENLKYHYEHTHGDILRKSIIISTIILLESEIDCYCRDFQKHKNIKVCYNDFKGDLLAKFKYFSIKIIDSAFDFNSTLWQNIVGLHEVRNCLIHNRGSLDSFNKRKTVEDFVKRNQSFSITDNEFIEVSQKACLDSTRMVYGFFEEITRLAFDSFPGKYGQN